MLSQRFFVSTVRLTIVAFRSAKEASPNAGYPSPPLVSDPAMKQIIAIVRPHLAEQVLASLRRAPIEAMSVVEAKGFGRQKSYLDEYQPTDFDQTFVPKVEITLWVDDTRCEEVLEKVVSVARCGRIGDGKIFMMPVSEFL